MDLWQDGTPSPHTSAAQTGGVQSHPWVHEAFRQEICTPDDGGCFGRDLVQHQMREPASNSAAVQMSICGCAL